MIYIGSEFSINMLRDKKDCSVLRLRKVHPSNISKSALSLISHHELAQIISNILGFEIPYQENLPILTSNDILYIVQYKGPDIPEGTTVLPRTATIEFFEVSMLPYHCRGCMKDSCSFCKNISWLRGYY